MNVLILVIGLAVLMNGLLVFIFSNFNVGILLTLALGIFLTVVGAFHGKVKEITAKGAAKTVKNVVAALICMELCLVGFIFVFGQTDTVTYDEDAVLVLGAGIRGERVTLPLKLRLDKAIEYSKKNKNALIVVSGGKGYQETVTEAEAMEKYLIKNGVSREIIIKEEEAYSTRENMRFSKKILDERLNGKYKVAVITNGFHIYRSNSYAKIEGFENATHLHSGLIWYNYLPCYLRESLAVIKMWILE